MCMLSVTLVLGLGLGLDIDIDSVVMGNVRYLTNFVIIVIFLGVWHSSLSIVINNNNISNPFIICPIAIA